MGFGCLWFWLLVALTSGGFSVGGFRPLVVLAAGGFDSVGSDCNFRLLVVVIVGGFGCWWF